MTLSDFQFDLPPALIAQVPAERRDQARLLVLDRRGGAHTHSTVGALPHHLRPGDLLVVNDTKVIPARLFARTASGSAVELLLVREISAGLVSHTSERGSQWLCLGKPAKRLRAGARLILPEHIAATVAAAHGNGHYTVTFENTAAVQTLLARYGELPLPPYIRRPDGPLPLDQTRYQTVFASAPGAIAAPTAGLHFTAELFTALQATGIEVVRLTLHVGPGTFLPVRTARLDQHVMEAEWCDIPAATAARIRTVKAAGGRVVAVGTTTTRALESAASDNDLVASGARWADCFIVPGHRFRVVDALFTNFHLPGSTLVMLVSAFAGRAATLAAYAEAVRHGYRFYSYGDAMLIQ